MNPGITVRGPRIDDYETPRNVFDPVREAFGLKVDAAASHDNHLLERYWTRETDGIRRPWAGERIWCNPPYSEIPRWAAKAANGGAEVAAVLLPATTGSWWFAEFVVAARAEVWFVQGRVRFLLGGVPMGNAPRFDSMIAIYRLHQPADCVMRTWAANKGAPVPTGPPKMATTSQGPMLGASMARPTRPFTSEEVEARRKAGLT